MEFTSEPINLWEAITAAELNWQKFDKGLEPRALGPRVKDTDVSGLSKSARWGGQELNVRATEEGWLIKVFSCYELMDEYSIQILIPKDSSKPAKIIKDRNGRIEHIHD